MKKYEMVKVNGSPYLVVEIDGDMFGGLVMDSYQWDDSYIYNDSTTVEWFDKYEIDGSLEEEVNNLIERSPDKYILKALITNGIYKHKIFLGVDSIPKDVISGVFNNDIELNHYYGSRNSEVFILDERNEYGKILYAHFTDATEYLEEEDILLNYSKEELENFAEILKKELNNK